MVLAGSLVYLPPRRRCGQQKEHRCRIEQQRHRQDKPPHGFLINERSPLSSDHNANRNRDIDICWVQRIPWHKELLEQMSLHYLVARSSA